MGSIQDAVQATENAFGPLRTRIFVDRLTLLNPYRVHL